MRQQQAGACQRRLLGHIIHQIVDVQHASTGEMPSALVSSLSLTFGPEGHRFISRRYAAAQFILRDQSHGEQQRRSCSSPVPGWACGSHPPGRYGDAGHQLLPLDIHHRVAQLQRDAVVVQTLDNVHSNCRNRGMSSATTFTLAPPASCGGP